MKRDRLAALILPLALAACGGGAGPAGVVIPQDVRDEPASAGSDVSVANYASFAAPAARLVLGATGDSLTGVFAAGRESPAGLSGTRPHGLLPRALAQAAASLSRERPQATSTQTQACDVFGTMTAMVDDVDGNQRLSAGDAMTVTVDHCVVVAGDPPLSGTFSLTVNAVELDGNLHPTAIDASGRFDAFTIGSVASLNGAFRLWYRQDTATSQRLRLSFKDVDSAVLDQSARYNVDVVATTSAAGGSYAIDGALGLGGQTYKIVQGPAPFGVPASGNVPNAGTLDLKDAAGDAMRLTAKANELVGIGFVPAGSQAQTAALADQLWSSLAP